MISSRSHTANNTTPRVLLTFISILGVLTAAALFFAYLITTHGLRGSMVSDALIVFAGITGVTAILAFQGLAQGYTEASLPSLSPPPTTFNETLVSQSLVTAQEQLPKIVSEPTDAEWREAPDRPWTLSAAALLELDPPLAMAKLRIDLETELRRITMESGNPTQRSSSNTKAMIYHLIAREVLPHVYEPSLMEVSRAANDAIHGSAISYAEASQLVKLGTQLLEQLHAYPVENSYKNHEVGKSVPLA